MVVLHANQFDVICLATRFAEDGDRILPFFVLGAAGVIDGISHVIPKI